MEQINNMVIGKKIMSLRKEAGLTQEQLAEKLGVSAQAVSKWENEISCPDISMLPMLASLFRVTVDDLLGVEHAPKQSETEAPSAEAAQEQEDESEGEGVERSRPSCCAEDAWEEDGGEGKLHGLGFALVLILLGAAFLLFRHFGPSTSIWSIAWPAIVLGLGVAWFIRQLAPLGLGMAFIGFYYLLQNLGRPLPFILDWDTIWPIGLVLLGLSILIDGLRWGKNWRARGMQWHRRGKQTAEYSEDTGFLQMRTVFGEGTRKIKSETLSGGRVQYVFAGGELDLNAVKALGDSGAAVLHVEVVFGGCTIFLPPHIRVDKQASCVVGGIHIEGAPMNPTATLTLAGDVVFGGIEIRYMG